MCQIDKNKNKNSAHFALVPQSDTKCYLTLISRAQAACAFDIARRRCTFICEKMTVSIVTVSWQVNSILCISYSCPVSIHTNNKQLLTQSNQFKNTVKHTIVSGVIIAAHSRRIWREQFAMCALVTCLCTIVMLGAFRCADATPLPDRCEQCMCARLTSMRLSTAMMLSASSRMRNHVSFVSFRYFTGSCDWM